MASLTISINRTSLTLAPLVMSAVDADDTDIGIIGYREPAMQPRIRYAPDSEHSHGSTPLSWAWQESILAFEVVTDRAATETEARETIAELVTAVARLRYETQVVVNGAPEETWRCRPGTVAPLDPRALPDLRKYDAAWSVSIPVYPVRRTL